MKNLSNQIRKIYPHTSILTINHLLNSSEQFISALSELQHFFAVYGVLCDELLKSTNLFPYNMVHVLLSLKKRIAYLQELHKTDGLLSAIALKNELDEEQLGSRWTAFFLTCEALQASIATAFAKRLTKTDSSHSVEEIPNCKIDDDLRQLLNHLGTQISDLKNHELFGLVKASEFNRQQTAVASVMPAQEEHPFFSMAEEVKVSILTHLDVEDLISAQLASKDLSSTAATAFAVRFRKNPAQVLAHLNEIPPEEAYNFVEGYRRTIEYKALKSLVEHKMPMSDEEVACYMLTRHHQQLPDIEQLKRICTASPIDEKTRAHLLMLIENTLEIDEAEVTYSPIASTKASGLFDLFLRTFPESYNNLLPSVHFENVNLVGDDLSRAPLSHSRITFTDLCGITLVQANLSYANLERSKLNVANLRQANLHHAKLIEVCFDNALLEEVNFSHADLSKASFRHTNLQQANLRGANLRGAVFYDTAIDGADFTGTHLAYTQLIDLDMRTIDLSQFHVEWSYLKKVRVVPDTALEHAEALEAFFNSFEKNLAGHTPGSQMKWRIQMLKDLKRLMSSFSLRPEANLLLLKKILLHYPPQALSSTLLTSKHPFQPLFEHFQFIQVEPPIEEGDHSLQEEVISILDGLQNRIDRCSKDEMEISLWDLEKKFDLVFAKVPGLTNVNQICTLSSHHFFLLQLFYLNNRHERRLKPYLVNHPPNNLITARHSLRYASEIFDGELFHLERLQKIQPEELGTYLYGDEDFIIKQTGRNPNRVKLGGLIISYNRLSKGCFSAKVEIIDFENRQLTFGFTLDPGAYSETYLPFRLINDLDTHCGFYLYPQNVAVIRAALEVRASMTHYIFATQKGPVPELVPITRIAPVPENENTEACAPVDKDESPLLGENRYGLYHRKAEKPCFTVAEKIPCCVLT
ncbi:pentapeptide repeat-containing protein [Legionella feeleii]|uniref:Type III effector pipB2 n=1 Tax=Legionella feeleii TaxID=453 RepID=A0A378J6D1_9GAMM|nr:pentapeptide repeat-containing protein [Legionella feeleii]STX39834.1 Type III effector pipB2 [Legionella feeleii]